MAFMRRALSVLPKVPQIPRSPGIQIPKSPDLALGMSRMMVAARALLMAVLLFVGSWAVDIDLSAESDQQELVQAEHVCPELNFTGIGLMKSISVDAIKTMRHYGKITLPDKQLTFDSLTSNIMTAVRADGYDQAALSNLSAVAFDWLVKDEVWDREELVASLNYSQGQVGEFACLLGGKSTGKSLIFKTMSAMNSSMIVLNMRFEPDLRTAFLKALASTKDKNLLRKVRESLERHAPLLVERAVPWIDMLLGALGMPVALGGQAENVRKAAAKLTEVLMKDKDSSSFKDTIVDIVQNAGNLTIVVDEANLVFDKSKVEDIQPAKDVLQLFTALTKETKKVNVLLVSSEYAFPFLLYEDLGFNLQNIEKLMFMGEVPPFKMFELLTTKWGMRDNLALALVDAFGGHIWNTRVAVKEIARGLTDFSCEAAWGATIEAVEPCLQWAEENDRVEDMRKALEALVSDSFYPIRRRGDPIARTIARNNVGGLVRRGGIMIGLNQSAWDGHNCNYGLVPSSQGMRLIIAAMLQDTQ